MIDPDWTAFVEMMERAGWVRLADTGGMWLYPETKAAYDPETGGFYRVHYSIWAPGPILERLGTQEMLWTDYADAGTTPAPF